MGTLQMSESSQQDWDYEGACEDRVIKFKKHVEDLRIPLNEQKNLSTCDVLDPNTLLSDNNNPNVQPQTVEDFMLKSLQDEQSTIPSSNHEVKEDLVKTEKKHNVDITEEPMERNHKNPPSSYLIINMIVGFIVLLVMFVIITRRFSLGMAKFSFRSGRGSTNYSPRSPRFDAESCPSVNDGETTSDVMLPPVSRDIAFSPRKVHQVFLNFRGEQLRFNFVSHLTDALQRNGIKFFIDKNEQRGKHLNNLFVRIQESRIALAIFSTRYPESKWCMNELVEMKKLAEGKLKLIVIPIFYNVDVEDVSKPTWDSEFGRNFLRLAEASNPDKVKEWKEALEFICDMMGVSLSEKSSESDTIEEIVKELQIIIEAMELEDEENHDGKKEN